MRFQLLGLALGFSIAAASIAHGLHRPSPRSEGLQTPFTPIPAQTRATGLETGP